MALVPEIHKVRGITLFLLMGRMCWSLRNVFAVLLGSILFSGWLLSVFDGFSLGEGLYLAFITATTIGYGDLSPETGPGRVVAVYIGVNGLVLTGLVVSVVVRALEMTFADDMEQLKRGVLGEKGRGARKSD